MPITLTYLGSYRMPRIYGYQFGDYFPQQHQGLAATDVPGEFIASSGALSGHGKAVFRMRAPSTLATSNLINAPKATLVGSLRSVGAQFVAAFGANASRIGGVAIGRDGKVYLNWGKYYDVNNTVYPNICRLDADLTNETPLMDVATPRPEMRFHAGWMTSIPAEWGGNYDLLRGSYWTQMVDYGPRMQLVDTDAEPSQFPRRTAAAADAAHAIAGRSMCDLYTGATCWSPYVAPPPPPPAPPPPLTMDEWRAQTDARLAYMRDNQKFEDKIEPPPPLPPPTVPPRFVFVGGSMGTASGWYGTSTSGYSPPNTADLRTPNANGVFAFPYWPEILVYSWESIQEPNPPSSVVPVQRIALTNFAKPANANISDIAVQGNVLSVIETGAVPFTNPSHDYANVVHQYEIGLK